MRTRTLTVLSLTLVRALAFVGEATAQERPREQRAGFIIGLGLGGGLVSIKESESAGGVSASVSRTEYGVSTDFRLGGQISPRTALYYSNKVLFYTTEGVTLAVTGVTGIGFTYVLPSAPVHLNAGLGLSVLTVLMEDGETDSNTGLGLQGGIAYEFAPRWLLDFGLLWGRQSPDDLPGLNFTRSETVVRLGITFLSL